MHRIAALERRGGREAALPRPRGLQVGEIKRTSGAHWPDTDRAAPTAEDAANASVAGAGAPTTAAATTLLFLPNLLHIGQPLRLHLLQSLQLLLL